MKTKEFIEKVESMGYKVDSDEYTMFVKDGHEEITSISKKRPFKIDTRYECQMGSSLFNLAVEYAKTPISKRSTKQLVKIKGLSLSTGDGLYLNFDPINGNYFVSDLNGYFKNKFTNDEIDGLVNDPGFFLQTGNYETEEAK